MRITRFIDDTGSIRLGTDERDGTAALLEGPITGPLRPTDQRRPIIKRLAPIDPRAIICVGLNYRQHAAEMNSPIPAHPMMFMKNPAALNDPDAPIVIPAICRNVEQVDFEAELAVVIGWTARDVPPELALDHVLGYTCANDISARWWQKHGSGGQFVRGKSFDGFCPLGPVLVTADEIPDPQNLRITCHVNGQVMQEDTTAGMIFSVAELVSQLSQGMTLAAGTVILTGTPSGVGTGRNPPVYLKAGDTVSVTIESIGTLTNPIVV
jgi:2-keto-4-pentenoate hydratase/2-oxohepta-3-ene-1,7-dioic acid hydratase in catechol pathway